MKSGLIKRSFSLAGRRTSVALEQEFWAALMRIAASRHQTLTQRRRMPSAFRGSH
jgi:predicted DNA-binding ribbon-helix-helix protein